MSNDRRGERIVLSEDNRERIRDFRQKYRLNYGEGHYIFALHAAFPVVFTPDLLYRIWVNFGTYPKRGDRETMLQIDSVAVSDLLLSNICEEVGVELYAMDKEVRRYFLEKLEKDERFGSRRVEMLADFLYQYAEHAYRQPTAQPFKETHQWTALSVSRPQEAVQQIAGALAGAIEKKNAGEQLRLFMMIDTFARDENIFDELFQFSRGVKEHIYGNTDYTVQMPVLTRSPKEGGIKLLSLPIPASLRGKIEREVPKTTGSVMDKIRKAKEEDAVFLDLSALGLTEIPAEVFQLTQLETLVLSENALTTLPPEIAKLSELKHLVMAQNHLDHLPDSIVRLEKLEVILLNENRLTDIPGGMFRLPQLGMVDLNNNLLTRLPGEIIEPPLEIEWLDDISSGYGVILVQGNPLEEPPVDIVKDGKEAITKYFKEQEILGTRKIFDVWKNLKKNLNDKKQLSLDEWAVFFRGLCEFLGVKKIPPHGKRKDRKYIMDIRGLPIGLMEVAVCLMQTALESSLETDETREINSIISVEGDNLAICLFFCFNRTERIALLEKNSTLNLVVMEEEDLVPILISKEPQETFRNLILDRLSLGRISPYQTSGPVRATFYGRYAIIRRIIDSTNQSFSIVGPRRIGKSSLLLKLVDNPPPKTVFIFMDLSAFSFERDNYKSFFGMLKKCLADTLHEKIKVKSFFTKQNISEFSDVIQRISRKIGKRIVFIFDEMDSLIKYDRKKNYKLFREFRYMSQENICQFIFIGFRELYTDKRSVKSPAYNFFEEIRLGPLEEREALEMITQSMERIGVRFNNPEDKRLILDYTGNHPNMLQYFWKHISKISFCL